MRFFYENANDAEKTVVRRGGRAADCTGLENRRCRKAFASSNLAPSAPIQNQTFVKPIKINNHANHSLAARRHFRRFFPIPICIFSDCTLSVSCHGLEAFSDNEGGIMRQDNCGQWMTDKGWKATKSGKKAHHRFTLGFGKNATLLAEKSFGYVLGSSGTVSCGQLCWRCAGF
jgi:hypothetical protein